MKFWVIAFAGITLKSVLASSEIVIDKEKESTITSFFRGGRIDEDGIDSINNSRVNVAIMTDKLLPLKVVVSTACKSSIQVAHDKLHFHILTNQTDAFEDLAQSLPSCDGAHFHIIDTKAATKELQDKGFHPFWKQSFLPADLIGGDWKIKTPYTSDKHFHETNLLRFYLPHLKAFDQASKILFLDYDIMINVDIVKILNLKITSDVAFTTGCMHWYWAGSKGFKKSFNMTVRETGYFGNLGNICSKDDENCVNEDFEHSLNMLSFKVDDKKLSVHAGRPLNRQAFNMGLSVINTNLWKSLGLTERFETIVDANMKQHILPPDTLGFGLGLGYLAIGESFACYDDQISHIVGLSFIEQETLNKEGFTIDTLQSGNSVLHYNGENKPWQSNFDHFCTNNTSPIRSSFDIWQKACVDNFVCECDDDQKQDEEDAASEVIALKKTFRNLGKKCEGEYCNGAKAKKKMKRDAKKKKEQKRKKKDDTFTVVGG